MTGVSVVVVGLCLPDPGGRIGQQLFTDTVAEVASQDPGALLTVLVVGDGVATVLPLTPAVEVAGGHPCPPGPGAGDDDMARLADAVVGIVLQLDVDGLDVAKLTVLCVWDERAPDGQGSLQQLSQTVIPTTVIHAHVVTSPPPPGLLTVTSHGSLVICETSPLSTRQTTNLLTQVACHGDHEVLHHMAATTALRNLIDDSFSHDPWHDTTATSGMPESPPIQGPAKKAPATSTDTTPNGKKKRRLPLGVALIVAGPSALLFVVLFVAPFLAGSYFAEPIDSSGSAAAQGPVDPAQASTEGTLAGRSVMNNPFKVHTEPNFQSAGVGARVQPDAKVSVTCSAKGQLAKGRGGRSRVWYYVVHPGEGYIPALYVDLVRGGSVPVCN